MQLSIAPVFLPGPRPDPLLGWRGALLPFANDPVGHMLWLHRRYGELVAISRSDPAMLFAFGPAHNRQLLSDPSLFENTLTISMRMPPDSAMARVSTGLLSMNGAKHRQQRRLMLPAFHRQHVAAYRDAMVTTIGRVLDSWAVGETRDIAAEMQQMTLGVALKTLFSLETTPEARALGRLFEQSLDIPFSPLESFVQLDLPGTGFHKLKRLAEQIERQVRALIAQRRALASDQQDVLATLIAARDEEGQALSDDELVGQTYTLFAAGHETSSNALTWTLLLLEQHPEALAELHAELDSVLGGAAPSLEQLGRLPLLDAVVKESLRLMPPASLLLRVSSAPFSMGCYELPAQTTIFFSPLITHRLPELYAQPQAFQPGRWATIEPSPYAYLPFGAGPRMCIGTTFALMEIKIALAMIVQRYRLALPSGARVDPELRLTLRPRGGLPMRILAQDRSFNSTPLSGSIHALLDLPTAKAAAGAQRAYFAPPR